MVPTEPDPQLTFEATAFPEYLFTIKSEMGAGQTGKFAALLRTTSRDLFASPSQSAAGQCSIVATSNETLQKNARTTGAITCDPNLIARSSGEGLFGINIGKWQFTAVVPLQ